MAQQVPQQVQMIRFPRVPHVTYGFAYMPEGRIQIHAECAVCGEPFDWMCDGGQRKAEWRVAQFANWHTHGVVPRVAFPRMPRG